MTEPRVRRQASEVRATLDKVSLLRGRLRSVLRSLPDTPSQVGTFDLVATVERAVADVCRGRALTLPVSSSEIAVPVSGDARKARLAITRALVAALNVAHHADLSVGVSTRSTESHRLEGSNVGELAVRVQGIALGVRELLPIVAALEGWVPVSGQRSSVCLRVAADETQVTAPGIAATSSSTGTWITLRWRIDLGCTVATSHSPPAAGSLSPVLPAFSCSLSSMRWPSAASSLVIHMPQPVSRVWTEFLPRFALVMAATLSAVC